MAENTNGSGFTGRIALRLRKLAAVALVAAAAGLAAAEDARGAIAGGSGTAATYSGTLSSNPIIRRQQLLADPDFPARGSTSVAYDSSIVGLADFDFGPGYMGSGTVEVTDGETTFLQSLTSFFVNPAGAETGYVQVQFFQVGTPGQIEVADGFNVVDEDGPLGVDTHGLFFEFLEGVPDSTKATYTIYADAGNRPSGNFADSLSFMDDEGRLFTVNAADIGSAEVTGALIPVPPALYQGGAALAGLAVLGGLRRMGWLGRRRCA